MMPGTMVTELVDPLQPSGERPGVEELQAQSLRAAIVTIGCLSLFLMVGLNTAAPELVAIIVALVALAGVSHRARSPGGTAAAMTLGCGA